MVHCVCELIDCIHIAHILFNQMLTFFCIDTGTNSHCAGGATQLDWKWSKTCSMIEEQTMMYVPILHTLQVLLKNETVAAEVCFTTIITCHECAFVQACMHALVLFLYALYNHGIMTLNACIIPTSCRLRMGTSQRHITYRIFVMGKHLLHIHSLHSIIMRYNFFSIMMSWKFVIH